MRGLRGPTVPSGAKTVLTAGFSLDDGFLAFLMLGEVLGLTQQAIGSSLQLSLAGSMKAETVLVSGLDPVVHGSTPWLAEVCEVQWGGSKLIFLSKTSSVR